MQKPRRFRKESGLNEHLGRHESATGPFCSNDFVQDLTHGGRIFRTLNIIDEFTKEALVIRVKRKLNPTDVLDALPGLADPRLHSA
jgi:hypothetical protein